MPKMQKAPRGLDRTLKVFCISPAIGEPILLSEPHPSGAYLFHRREEV